jgi:hypothetical protein
MGQIFRDLKMDAPPNPGRNIINGETVCPFESFAVQPINKEGINLIPHVPNE